MFNTIRNFFKRQTKMPSRPGLRPWLSVGDGPIRAVYSQPGSFDDALFVLSGTDLYRIDQDETVTFLATEAELIGDQDIMALTSPNKEREVLNPQPDFDSIIALGGDGRYHIIDSEGRSVQSYARARDARRGLTRRFGITS